MDSERRRRRRRRTRRGGGRFLEACIKANLNAVNDKDSDSERDRWTPSTHTQGPPNPEHHLQIICRSSCGQLWRLAPLIPVALGTRRCRQAARVSRARELAQHPIRAVAARAPRAWHLRALRTRSGARRPRSSRALKTSSRTCSRKVPRARSPRASRVIPRTRCP